MLRPHLTLASFLLLMSSPALLGQVSFRDPAGRALVAESGRLEVLADDLQFSEGPVWLAADQRLVFSDIPAGKLLQWTADKGVQEYLAVDKANGNTLDARGRLLSCQHGARNVVRREKDGAVTVLAALHDGVPLNSPNDLAVRDDGTIWFTDPTYGLERRKREQKGNFVYRLDPATSLLEVVCKEFDQPNGICFSPDHQRLYVADSGKGQRIGAFPVDKDGKLGAPVFWIAQGSDGMRCDALGNLWTTGLAGLTVYSPEGKPLVEIECPSTPTNCAFGGADGKTLFVTARKHLCLLPVLVAGAPLPSWLPAADRGATKSGDEDGTRR